MKAAPEAQRRLLDLQAVDTAVAQLQHRRRQLPEHAKIAAAQAERTSLGEQITASRTRIYDLEQEQAKSEADLAPVRERRVRDQHRVDSGQITDPKQLRALLDEIAHLGRRISDLEDAELEAMERLEAADALVAEQQAVIVVTNEEGARLSTEAKELISDATTAVEQLDRDRAAVVARVPEDLFALYSRIARNGVGAGLFRENMCEACRVILTASDVARVRTTPDDEVIFCPECGAILVRTEDSGY